MEEVAIIKKKKRPNVRKTTAAQPMTIITDDDTSSKIESKPKIPKKTKKDKKDKKKPKLNTLSFGDEENEDDGKVFKVKKHKSSIYKSSSKRSKAGPPAPMSTMSTRVGEYTAERLSALKDQTHAAPKPVAQDDHDLLDPTEPAPNSSRLAAPTIIPSARQIHEARKRREQARQGEEFIPLDGEGSRTASSPPPSYEARIRARVRPTADEDLLSDDSQEGEELKSFGEAARGDDKQAEIQSALLEADQPFASSRRLKNRTKLVSESKKGRDLLIEETTNERSFHGNFNTGERNTSSTIGTGRNDNDHDEDDRAVERWEQQQIQLGQRGAKSERHLRGVAEGKNKLNIRRQRAARLGGKPAALSSSTNISRASSLVTLQEIEHKLMEAMSSLNEVHRSHVQNLQRLEEDLTEATDNIPKLEDAITDASARYRFYQETRGYIRDLLGCLDAKVPLIDDTVNRSHLRLKRRADYVFSRREELLEARIEMGSGAGRALDSASSGIVQAWKARRRRRHDINNETEGFSTDDEIDDGELSDDEQLKDQVELEKGKIFEDVLAEFSELPLILAKFKKWKQEFPREYRDAYVSQSLEKVLLPLVKFALLDWNPLSPESSHFESLPFFTHLLEFCDDADDPDADMIPNILELVLVKKLTGLGTFVWDPLSTAQTERLRDLLECLMKDYPTVSKERELTKDMLNGLTVRIKQTVEVVSIPDKMFLHDLVKDQMLKSIKLMKNICLLGHVLEKSSIQQIVLSQILKSSCLPVLQSSNSELTMTYVQEIASALPREWFAGESFSARIASQALSPFIEFLKEFARGHRDCLGEITKVLSTLGQNVNEMAF
eukprot:m.63395 g.63395  ORF g.63395 m.63395 type:complete len:837 (-) comp19456_c0_seq2:102-2612(-)